MKKTIALLCNIRSITDPNDPQFNLEADFDDEATINGIKEGIEANGYDVIIIQGERGNPAEELAKYKSSVDMVFNFCEGEKIPNILEALQIPYTGSSADAQAAIYNKAKTKEILLQNDIATPDFQVFTHDEEIVKSTLQFPLIVKPLCQGSSAGITNKSVVYNEKELKDQIMFVLDMFGGKALVETFLEGREFSVGMVGNPPQILPIIEANHEGLPAGYAPIDSLEVKRLLEEENSGHEHLFCPAVLDHSLEKDINAICMKTWSALDIRDYCRIDIRCDGTGQPYILEVNSPAGLIPPTVSVTSYLPLMARKAGVPYEKLIGMILQAASQRYET